MRELKNRSIALAFSVAILVAESGAASPVPASKKSVRDYFRQIGLDIPKSFDRTPTEVVEGGFASVMESIFSEKKVELKGTGGNGDEKLKVGGVLLAQNSPTTTPKDSSKPTAASATTPSTSPWASTGASIENPPDWKSPNTQKTTGVGTSQAGKNGASDGGEEEYIKSLMADGVTVKDNRTRKTKNLEFVDNPLEGSLVGPSINSTNKNPNQGFQPGGSGTNNTNQIPVKIGNTKQRGINIKSEVPSVRHVTMSPASKRFGGDDVEVGISPIFDVMIQMPEQVEYFRSSNAALNVTTVASNANMVVLKLAPVDDVLPISLHLVDVQQNIYTFTIIGMPADLAFEYPKTIIVNRRQAVKTVLGAKNPRSIIDAMDVDDATQIVVGDVPKTSDYQVDLVSGKYQHYQGYVMYSFRVSKKDKGKIDTKKLNYTIWANDKRLDAGNAFSSSRNVEWSIDPILSKRETRRKGHDTLRVFVQIRASILDLEDWTNTFITINDKTGYTRFDFPPLIRSFRAPNHEEMEPLP
jgi:hypothetical protein